MWGLPSWRCTRWPTWAGCPVFYIHLSFFFFQNLDNVAKGPSARSWAPVGPQTSIFFGQTEQVVLPTQSFISNFWKLHWCAKSCAFYYSEFVVPKYLIVVPIKLCINFEKGSALKATFLSEHLFLWNVKYTLNRGWTNRRQNFSGPHHWKVAERRRKLSSCRQYCQYNWRNKENWNEENVFCEFWLSW